MAQRTYKVPTAKKWTYPRYVVATAQATGKCYFTGYLNMELREVIRDIEATGIGEIHFTKAYGYCLVCE